MVKPRRVVYCLIAASFLMTAGFFAVQNYRIIFSSVSGSNNKISGFEDLVTEINYLKKDKLPAYRYEMIDLSGKVGSNTGRRYFNEIILMKNGMLTGRSKSTSVVQNRSTLKKKTEDLREFSKFVTDSGGYFLFALYPSKYDLENKLMPDGWETKIPAQMEILMDSFRNAGIDVINTQSLLAETPSDIEENFYRTDHHWKPEAAFKAYQMIMARLKEIFPDEPYDEEMMKIENWTIHEMPDQFLGSRGRRVGVKFAGMDDLQWITPDFETSISFYENQASTLFSGDFEKALIVKKYIEPNTDPMHNNNYYVYFGGDYALLQIKNRMAPSSQKLLIIKDSFSIPLQAFLAVQFREVDSLDPREYNATSIREYVDQTRPDIVLMGLNAEMVSRDEYFVFSAENEEFLTDDRILLAERSGSMEPNEKKNNYNVLYDSFENGKYYTVKYPEITVTAGSTNAVSIVLYDRQNKPVLRNLIDFTFCNDNGPCEWTFRVPESCSADTGLLLYAGIKEKTAGIGIDYRDFRIYERVIK